MAKATKPGYAGFDKEGCDRICIQLLNWWELMTNFENKDHSKREDIVNEMMSHYPILLSNVRDAITAFEKDRLDNIKNLEVVMKHMHYWDLSLRRVSWMTKSISKQQSERLQTMKDELAALKIEELLRRIAKKTKELGTSRPAHVQRQDVVAVTVRVWTPDQRNEVVEGIYLDENEQIETAVYHIYPRQVREVTDLPKKKVEESLDISQSFDEKEMFVKRKEDKITLSLLFSKRKQYLKYNLRINRNGTWEKTEGKQRNKYIDFEFELLAVVDVVLTSTTKAQSVQFLPNVPTDYRFVENPNITLHCPVGAVKEELYINVLLISVDKKAAMSNRDKCFATNIIGVSSIVHIKHERPFEKDLSLTLPIEMLEEADLSTCDLVSFHCVDNDTTVTKSDEYQIDLNDDKTCTLRTKHFSGQAVAAIQRHTSAQAPVNGREFEMIHGLSDPCNILIFLGRGLNNREWMMMAEIVPELESKARIASRKTNGNFAVPLHSKSGTVVIKRDERIKVNINKKGTMEFGPEITKPPSIRYDRNATEQYVLFPARVKQGIHRSTRAIVEFSRGETIFHTAYPCPDLLEK